MIGWHHQLNGHEFEQAPRDGERQGSLVCCSLWGHKESDMTQRINNICGQRIKYISDRKQNKDLSCVFLCKQ